MKRVNPSFFCRSFGFSILSGESYFFCVCANGVYVPGMYVHVYVHVCMYEYVFLYVCMCVCVHYANLLEMPGNIM